MKKQTWRIVYWMASMMLCVTAVAQTNLPPVMPPDINLPSGQFLWQTVIAIGAPILVWLLRIALPKVPSALLPAIAPVIGWGIGLVLNWMSVSHLSWYDAGLAGAAGVALREIVNQNVSKQLSDSKPTTN